MARIVLSLYSNVTWTKFPYLDSFVEGFTDSLRRAGNDMLILRNNEFVGHQYNHELRQNLDYPQLINDVTAFNPDLIISFNNSVPHPDLIHETGCPIIVYASDAPCYFLFKETIKQHSDRYYFLHSAKQMTESLKTEFPFLNDSQFIDFGYATDLRAADYSQDINISFVGSIGNYSMGLPRYFANPLLDDDRIYDKDNHVRKNQIKKYFFQCLDEFENDSMNDFKFTFPKPDHISKSVESTVVHILTCRKRFEVLAELTDLNLKIFGYPVSWAQTITYNYDMFRSFDYELVVSMEHSTRIFNSSKISLNLPHGFTTDGFSWRVCDILASNAVLLSPRKKDLERIVRGYVDLPMYESKGEARDLAVKLLGDDVWRKEITTGSQAAVNDQCRFEPKLRTIEQAVGNLILFQEAEGSVRQVNPHHYSQDRIS